MIVSEDLPDSHSLELRLHAPKYVFLSGQANNPTEQISSAHSYSLRKQSVLYKVQYLKITAFLERFHGRSSLDWSGKGCGWSSAFWDRKPF